MMTYLYGVSLLVTVAVFIYMAQNNYNRIDIYQWTVVIMVPIIVMAYWLKTRATTPAEAEALFCFIYLDSTFMITVVLFSLLHTLGIAVKPWLKILGYGMAAIHMAVVCLCVHTGLYYRTVSLVDTGIGIATQKTGGPLRAVHYVFLGAILLCMVIIAVIGIRKKGAYDRDNLNIFLLLSIGSMVMYTLEGVFELDFSMLPFLYTVADVIIAMRYDHSHIHDIDLLVAEHHDHHDARGYLALSMSGAFLCCNEKSYEFLPVLRSQRVNEALSREDEAGKSIWHLLRNYRRDGTTSTKYRIDDRTYVCELSEFSIRENGKRQGCLLEIRDATEEQQAYDIIATYNETLNAQVKSQTESIRDMQRKIVLGMANMIENRDNNTGGHVKRTSDIIHILVDEIIRQGKIPMSPQMAEDIVRAAPTHDLGKITIDSNILNKPGKLTDEEYTIMKTHSTKSGELVLILLDGVEEKRFVDVAYRVARYHHERWDGKGYPEGLVGTTIPLEARIMAVADVYDALVSKRVYKEPMSFEKSAAIMCECMGTQFDPNMKSVFLGCRERMEQYYRQNDR